jgi:hypothetical protein
MPTLTIKTDYFQRFSNLETSLFMSIFIDELEFKIR